MWKSIHKQQLVNESFVEISFDIADPDAVADAAAEDNGAVYISNTPQIVSEVDKEIVPYATLEENLWLLDGSRRFIPDTELGDNGYIGNILSDSMCRFEKTPVVDIKFSEVHEPIIPGITITWGSAYNEYPKEFKVTAYNGLSVVANKWIPDNNTVKSVVEMDIQNYDRIRIEILRWCLPHHRPRISEIFVGINKVYSKSDIMGYEHEMEVSPIGETTPTNKVSFSIDNSNNQYDPNNVTGLSKYLMERQEMRVRYGLKLNDESREYIPGGVFYLSEWDAPQNGMEATFVARDLLEFMRKIYTKGLYRPNGISLYDLAIDVLTEADLPLNDDGTVKWVLDESLKNIYTVAPLSMVSLAECLQCIAHAARCVCYCDRGGILRIEPIATVKSDYELTTFNMFSRPEISLQKPLKAINTKVYNYFVEDIGKELYNGNVVINGTREIAITYSNPAVNTIASVSGGSLVSAVYYTNICYLTIQGDGEVSINVTGDILRSSDTEYSLTVGEEGENQTVANPLITSSDVASAVSEWAKEWLNHRKVMNMGDWRADPRLDAMDIISSENKYSNENIRMTSVKYTYAGAFKGTGEGRVV
jgi:hypothetical protein